MRDFDPEVHAGSKEGQQKMRDLCEAALTAGGLHVTGACMSRAEAVQGKIRGQGGLRMAAGARCRSMGGRAFEAGRAAGKVPGTMDVQACGRAGKGMHASHLVLCTACCAASHVRLLPFRPVSTEGSRLWGIYRAYEQGLKEEDPSEEQAGRVCSLFTRQLQVERGLLCSSGGCCAADVRY